MTVRFPYYFFCKTCRAVVDPKQTSRGMEGGEAYGDSDLDSPDDGEDALAALQKVVTLAGMHAVND